jgi:hypothetical protein
MLLGNLKSTIKFVILTIIISPFFSIFLIAVADLVFFVADGAVAANSAGFLPFASVFLIYSVLLAAVGVILGIVVYSYLGFHTKEPPEAYFAKFGAMEAISKYRLLNRLFYVMALLSVLAFTTIVIASMNLFYGFNIFFVVFFLSLLEGPALASITISLAIIRYSRLKKDFDFYLTRAYFTLASQKDDETEKLKYLNQSLDAYNVFLERKLNLKINNIMRIYSTIISASAEQKLKIRESVGKALEKDKMELARQLAELSSLPDEEEFLQKESSILNQRFKDILTVMIPAVISIVTFIIATITQVLNNFLAAR